MELLALALNNSDYRNQKIGNKREENGFKKKKKSSNVEFIFKLGMGAGKHEHMKNIKMYIYQMFRSVGI